MTKQAGVHCNNCSAIIFVETDNSRVECFCRDKDQRVFVTGSVDNPLIGHGHLADYARITRTKETTTVDIVTRLQDQANAPALAWLTEAADEIERLRAEVAMLRDELRLAGEEAHRG